MKKIIWILVVLIIIIGLAGGTYWYFDREQGGAGMSGLSVGDFFPFGQSPDPEPGIRPVVPVATTTDTTVNIPTPRLWKIYSNPQAGAGFFERNGEMFVRFVDSAMGNVFENKVGESLTTRISNTTIPKVREAIWLASGESVILRYVTDADVIQTLFTDIVPASESNESEGGEVVGGAPSEDSAGLQELRSTFLAGNIESLSVGPRERIFYITKTSAKAASAFVANPNGERATKIFDSPVSEWVGQWPRENTLVIATRASASARGFAYGVNSTSGTIQRLIGNVPGLFVRPSYDLTKIAYSETSAGGASSLKLLTVATGAITNLGTTLADKCVWMKDNVRLICAVPTTFPSATYPDNWYDGRISFTDKIFMIDSANGNQTLLADPSDIVGETVDATKLTLDKNENVLLFTNKKDSSLWSLRINEI